MRFQKYYNAKSSKGSVGQNFTKIMRSAVPLPCFLNVVKYQRVQSPLEWFYLFYGPLEWFYLFYSICPSVHSPSVHNSIPPMTSLRVKRTAKDMRAYQRVLRYSVRGRWASQRSQRATGV